MAALHALTPGHRVAVLVETPTPDAMCEDVVFMVQSVQPEGDDCHTALLGVVTDDGELQRRNPFARSRPRLTRVLSVASTDAIPPSALPVLRQAVAERRSGLLAFGSEIFDIHPAIELVAAALALTEHAGPAARIMPRKRSTPAKDWLVPEAIKPLPFLPSIESAYDQGYRRMIVTPDYSSTDLLLQYGERVLFISGVYGTDVMDVFMTLLRGGGMRNENDLLKLVIAILGVMPVPTKHGVAVASDMFVTREDTSIQSMKFDEIDAYLQANRTLKWHDEIARLLDSRAVTAAAMKRALPRSRSLKEFLSQRDAKKKAMPSGARH